MYEGVVVFDLDKDNVLFRHQGPHDGLKCTAWTTPVGIKFNQGQRHGPHQLVVFLLVYRMEKGVGVVRWHCVRCQHLFKEVCGRKAKATVPGAVRWRWLHVNKSSAFTRTVQGSVWEEGEGNSAGCSAVAVAVVTNFCVKFHSIY